MMRSRNMMAAVVASGMLGAGYSLRRVDEPEAVDPDWVDPSQVTEAKPPKQIKQYPETRQQRRARERKMK